MSLLLVNDASGKYAGGSHQHRFVDRYLCDSLNKETKEYSNLVQGNVSVNVSQVVPYPVRVVVLKYRATILEKEQEVG